VPFAVNKKSHKASTYNLFGDPSRRQALCLTRELGQAFANRALPRMAMPSPHGWVYGVFAKACPNFRATQI
jgi:hypothetical protein